MSCRNHLNAQSRKLHTLLQNTSMCDVYTAENVWQFATRRRQRAWRADTAREIYFIWTLASLRTDTNRQQRFSSLTLGLPFSFFCYPAVHCAGKIEVGCFAAREFTGLGEVDLLSPSWPVSDSSSRSDAEPCDFTFNLARSERISMRYANACKSRGMWLHQDQFFIALLKRWHAQWHVL